MKYSIALIYLGFFALIGIAVYATKSGLPLFALLLTPNCSWGTDKKDKKDDEE